VNVVESDTTVRLGAYLTKASSPVMFRTLSKVVFVYNLKRAYFSATPWLLQTAISYGNKLQ